MIPLSATVERFLKLYEEERRHSTYKVEGPLPPEVPIEPGTPVLMLLDRYCNSLGGLLERRLGLNEPLENPWQGSDKAVSGVVASINYGRSQNEERNHWRYHVAWANERWDLEQPDGVEVTMVFSSEPGMIGWPHLWRHDLLIAMRGLPAREGVPS